MNGISSPWAFWFLGNVVVPTTRGRYSSGSGEMYVRQSLPDDPVGVFTLTLTNLVVGSAIHIESVSGTALHNRVANSASEVISIGVYAPGSPFNDLRIKVRKGSASPYYQPWETQVTAVVGSQSIYVSQIPDE